MARKKKDTVAEVASQAEQMERDLSAIRRAIRKPLVAEVAKGRLTTPQSAVMRAVVRRPAISLKDLSREVSLAHSTVSGIADRLERLGMIARHPDQADGRIVRIHPTDLVNDWIRERLPALRLGPLQAALEKAEPTERESLAKAVSRLRELLTGA